MTIVCPSLNAQQSPLSPANWPDDDFTYEVRKQRSSHDGFRIGDTIAEFDTFQEAVAFVGNTEQLVTWEVNLYGVDREDGRRSLLEVAEWDTDLQRYLMV